MSDWNFEVLFAVEKAKLRERSALVHVEDSVMELEWPSVPLGALYEAEEWLKDNRATVTLPRGTFNEYAGTYRSAGISNEVNGERVTFIQNLAYGWHTVLNWADARVVDGKVDSEDSTLLNVQFPNLAQGECEDLAYSVRNDKYTSLVVGGEPYSGTWYVLQSGWKWEEDGSGTVELLLGDPLYEIEAFTEYLTLDENRVINKFNVPKRDVVGHIQNALLVHGSSVEFSYSHSSDVPGTVDLRFTYDGMRTDEGAENDAFDFSEEPLHSPIKWNSKYNSVGRTWMFFNRTNPEVLALQEAVKWYDENGAEEGENRRLDVRQNRRGNFDVTVDMTTKDVKEDIDYDGTLESIDGLLVRITDPERDNSETEQRTYGWYDVKESAASAIRTKLRVAPAGWFVEEIASRPDQDEGLTDILWTIQVIEAEAYTIDEEGGNDQVADRNDSKTVTYAFLNRSVDPEDDPNVTLAPDERVTERVVRDPDRPVSSYMWSVTTVGTVDHLQTTEQDGAENERLTYLFKDREDEPVHAVPPAGFKLIAALSLDPSATLGDYRYIYQKIGTVQHQINYDGIGGLAEEFDLVLINRETKPSAPPTIAGYKCITSSEQGTGDLLVNYRYRYHKVQTNETDIQIQVIGFIKSGEFEEQLEMIPNVDDDKLDDFMAELADHDDSDKVVRTLRADYKAKGVSNIVRSALILPATTYETAIKQLHSNYSRFDREDTQGYALISGMAKAPKVIQDVSGIVTEYDVTDVIHRIPSHEVTTQSKVVITYNLESIWYEKDTSGNNTPDNVGTTTINSYTDFSHHEYTWFPLGYWKHQQYDITVTFEYTG